MDRMDDKGITQAALAEKIGTSPAYISKVMRGDANFTLATMTKLAMAVDGKIKLCIADASPMAGAIDTDRPSAMAPPARSQRRVGAG
jgi:transcriptional regulator with XRE-family HTH domain